MAVTSLEEAYTTIRQNGGRGLYTSKWSIQMPTISGELVADMLTPKYYDIAEEDDGKLFSVKDWSMISENAKK